MSLLKKASIITTPTAYAEDYLYSIKPAYALGENLVSNGGFDTDTDWSKTTGWTISGGKANWNPADAPYNNDIYRAFSFVEGTRYRITFTMSNNTTGRILLRLSGTGNQDVNGVYTYYANGTHTVEFKAQADKNFLRIYGHDSYSSFSIDDFSLRIITDADFDFDRNSTGTRVNEDYLIEDVPYNLFVQSNQFDTTWFNSNSTDTSGQAGYNYSNDAWRIDITGAAGYISQSLAQSGLQTASVFVKAGTLNFVRCRVTGTGGNKFVDVNLTNGAIGTTGADNINATSTNIGQGWYRITLTYNATLSAFLIYPIQADSDFTATSGNIYIQNAQLVKGDQPKDYLKTTDRLDIPRIDYTNGEPSILLEPSRTNVVRNSEDFTTNWTAQGITLTANQITSPDGNTKGSLIQSTSTGSCVFEPTNVNLTIGVTYTYSFFVKKGNNQWVRLAHISSGVTGCWFDLDNGVLGTVNSESATIDKYPNGWYRITNTFVATHSSSGNSAFIGICDNNGSTNAGVIGQNVYIYGAQIEAGSYATSLIHTSGSAVTRSADVSNNAGNSDLISSTEGVIYGEINIPENIDDNINIAISDGTNTEFVKFIYLPASSLLKGEIKGSGNTIAKNDTSFVLGSYSKVAVSYKSGEFKLYVNGSQIGNTLIGHTLPTGLNTVSFDRGDGNANFYGNSKMIAVFKEALSDEELACLTGYNNHELYMNYYNRLSYLGLAEEYNVESDINNYIL